VNIEGGGSGLGFRELAAALRALGEATTLGFGDGGDAHAGSGFIGVAGVARTPSLEKSGAHQWDFIPAESSSGTDAWKGKVLTRGVTESMEERERETGRVRTACWASWSGPRREKGVHALGFQAGCCAARS
jgi:hypothetical protein